MNDSIAARGKRSWLAKAWHAFRVLQVRLRFALVLLAVFLIVGQWDAISGRLGTWIGRFGGAAGEQAVSPSSEYFCPMCPGVLSAWPSPCPVCSMPLVRRSKEEMGILPDGVLARMQISPYRLQLGGIATSKVEYHELATEQEGDTAAGNAQGREMLYVADLEPYRSQPRGLPELLPGELRIAYVCPSHPWQVSGEPRDCPLDAAPLVEQPLEANERLRWSCPIHPTKVADAPGAVCEGCAGLPLLPAIIAYAPERAVLAVPETAVIELGGQQVVFAASAPGVFDAVRVQLGPRVNGYYPLVGGLRCGSEVVTQGTFLLDAETRLDPNVAATYFGADTRNAAGPRAQGSTSSTAAASSDIASLLARLDLTEQQRWLARRQRTCPVTNLPLGSMGAPVEAEGEGQRVLLCCEGCRERFEALHDDTRQSKSARRP